LQKKKKMLAPEKKGLDPELFLVLSTLGRYAIDGHFNALPFDILQSAITT
jgi:hypothetical protein